MAKWIWVNKDKYEGLDSKPQFCIAEFINSCTLKEQATLKICADVRYELYINGKLKGRGPVATGHDYVPHKMTYSYFDEYLINEKGNVEFKILVSGTPYSLCEYTFDYPSVYFELKEGETTILESNESWKSRILKCRKSHLLSDFTVKEDEYTPSSETKPVHTLSPSQIEHLIEEKIYPKEKVSLRVVPHNKKTQYLDFDKIYSAYSVISIKCEDKAKITIKTAEADGVGEIYEEIITDKSITFSPNCLKSIGQAEITLESLGDKECEITDFYILYSHYPVKNEAYLKTSSPLIDKIYDVCMHTLKICRQDMHLDSPTHREPLACTGDYYIQALMEYLNIYDPTLTRFDIVRTCEFLKKQEGKMFHTTYSLIVPMWIYDYYQYTGDKTLLEETKSALKCLFSTFESYLSRENGLLEYAPNYMFVDWIVMKDEEDPYGDAREMMNHSKIDGFSLHHPPKVLGQSVLCMFYYKALLVGNEIFLLLNDKENATKCLKLAKELKEAINKHLYCKEKELYIGGLETPDMVEPNNWLPKNIERAFYLKQANVLSVLYGIAPNSKRERILEYVVKDLRKEEMQPYFYHFLLEALYNEGLFEKYGMPLINRYESLIKKCDKGLSEAWEYIRCDLSHAWGGTPAYILKKALSGFEIVEAGCKKIKLSPSLQGLDFAELNISTPYGNIEIKQEKGKAPIIKAPKEIEIL